MATPREEVKSQIKLTASQLEASKLAKTNANRYVLYRGGSRSGKSYLLSYIVFMRAMSAPGSRHGVFRKTQASCRQTLFDLTFREVMETTYPGVLRTCLINESEATITLPNGPDPRNPFDGGSIILFLGLDDGRRDKILGNEFATIWINECTEVDYDHVSFLMTRLNQKKNQNRVDAEGNPVPLKPKMFFDCNPKLETDWDFKCFKLKINPKDNTKLHRPEQWVEAKLDPDGNAENVDADYLETLNNLSVREKRRFVAGEWSKVNENALFRQEDIDQHRCTAPTKLEDMVRIVIAVDPAVTNHQKSDMTGIAVVGKDVKGEFYVLHDGTAKLPPEGWASKVGQLFREYQADRVIAEANQGGDLVSANLRANGNANLPITMVRAYRGKELRAEPVAALYERGKVHHPQTPLYELEEQMGIFGSPHFKGSPDRLDALVYAITELADLNGNEPKRGYQQIQVGGRNR